MGSLSLEILKKNQKLQALVWFSCLGIGLAAMSGCREQSSTGSAVSNNGEVVQNPYEDPTVVQLSIADGGICTGALMEENGTKFVLTAAHCVLENHKSTKLLPASRIRVNINGTYYTGANVVAHPLYKGEPSYDIALIFLDPSVVFPKVRTLGAPPRVGDVVKVDGFGVFAMSYVVDDSDGDGVRNQFDYCPNTGQGQGPQVDSKGCAFDQTPENFSYREPIGNHRSGIRRSGWNEIGEVTTRTITLRNTFFNGSTQVNGTQVASGDSGGPLQDARGNVIGVVSMARFQGGSADSMRASLYANVTTPCNRDFIRTQTTASCQP